MSPSPRPLSLFGSLRDPSAFLCVFCNNCAYKYEPITRACSPLYGGRSLRLTLPRLALPAEGAHKRERTDTFPTEPKHGRRGIVCPSNEVPITNQLTVTSWSTL
eukprot:6368464-Pyramimonas_sp.AAC.3